MRNTTVFERHPSSEAAIDRALAGAKHAPFWLDDLAGEAPIYPTLSGTVSTDLVIVGGGYAGLWSAVRAKERDPERRVILLEAKRIVWAASGRNGGFCESSITHGYENGKNRWPDELDTLERLGHENLDGIAETVERYGMDCEFERTGALTVAIEPHEVEWLEPEEGTELLDEAGVQAEVNSPTFLAGSIDRRAAAMVNPAKLGYELARVATELGVEIYEHALVNAVETPSGGGVRVRTRGGAVVADHAILATNVFPSLLKRNRLMTVPVYDYALMTEPLTDEQMASIGWQGRYGIADMANQFHYYRLSADNRILFGGYDAVYHYGKRVDPAYEDRESSYRKLVSHFQTTFPQLSDVTFTHRWSGPIDSSTQFCAFFGLAREDRIAYAAGFTGLGVGATRFAADVMLDLLAGEKTERTELEMVRKRPLPFPPEPIAAIGVQVTRWSMNQADHNGGRRNILLRILDKLGLGFDS